MDERRTRLAELCHDERIGVELVEHSRDLQQVLDRTLAECERSIESGSPDTLGRLRGLVKLAIETRSLQRESTLDAMTRATRELARVDRELSAAETHADRLQQQLDETLRDLGRSGDVDAARLGGLFDDLSRLCHKINNPLTSAMGRAQMLQMIVRTTGDEKVAKAANVIEESSKRVAALVQELANVVCHGRKEFVERYDSSNGSRSR